MVGAATGHELRKVGTRWVANVKSTPLDTRRRQAKSLLGVVDPACIKQRLMELYFAEGGDLTDPKVLIQAAVDCGMDGDLVRRLLASDADIDRIEGEATGAREAGIDGVPCFIFGGHVIVTGAQSPEYLASAIERTSGRHSRLRA